MLKLIADKREITGKKLATKRTEGIIPGIVYGPKMSSTQIFIDEKNFSKVWKEAGESTMVSLEMTDGGHDVLIHDVDLHPVTNKPIHVDFYALDTSKPITVNVPLEFEGVSPAVKSLGAILLKVMHEIEIEVLPKDLPHSLIADVSVLSEIGSQLTAKDIKLPASAKLITGPDEIVAIADVPKEEEEVSAPIDLASIEVEKKGKTEEETAETPES